MRLLLVVVISILSNNVYTQGSILNHGNYGYDLVDRLHILSNKNTLISPELKPYQRGEVVALANHVDTAKLSLTSKDRFDLYYLFKDNNEWLLCPDSPTSIFGKKQPTFIEAFTDSTGETYYKKVAMMDACEKDSRYIQTKKPFLKYFYKSPANFFEVNKKSFHLRVNPILDFKVFNQLESQNDGALFLNLRGLEIRGGIDERIYFYSSIIESQGRFATYVRDYQAQFKTFPKAGLLKPYNSSLFDSQGAIDYNYATAILGFNLSPSLGVQFGHGSNFIGNGYRSLLLSDFGANYLHLKLNWKLWKFRYQNLFAELNAISPNSDIGDQLIPKKYVAAHYLSLNLWKGANLGIFEATIFNRNEGEQFELQYLNPIILYRSVEQFIGSPDNVMLGANFRWNFFKQFQFYTQIIVDEFKLSENRGWWANKYGVQVGLKYINAFGIDHLDLQAEVNAVRPYTYTHRDSLGSNYSNNHQALAHPLGANFREIILKGRYQFSKKWLLDGRIIRAESGLDDNGSHWGSNFLIPTDPTTIEQSENNEIGQGFSTDILIVGLDVSYQLRHNLFLEVEYFYRNRQTEQLDINLTDSYFGGGIRWNIGRTRLDF